MSAAPAPLHTHDALAINAREFDASRYVTIPLVDPTQTISLVRNLHEAAPDDLGGAVEQARQRMRKDGAALEKALTSKFRALVDTDLRPTYYDLGGLWRCAHGRIREVADLSAALPERAMARTQMTKLFPDGADFTTRASGELLVESELRLEMLTEKAMQSAFVRLNGQWMLDGIRGAHAVHAEYAAQARVATEVAANADGVNRAVSEARTSVLAYVRNVVATVDERRPETVARAEKALAPIEALREARRRSAAKSKSEPADAETSPAGTADDAADDVEPVTD